MRGFPSLPPGCPATSGRAGEEIAELQDYGVERIYHPHDGMALGLTQQLPADEKHNYSRDYLQDQIAILLGGRIAEEITMNSLTTGAGNDLERSTEMARKMVCEWGMSDALGPLTFGKKEEQIFLGREIAQHQDYSEDTALKIDQEVKRFVTVNYERAHKLLTEHKDVLLKMADAPGQLEQARETRLRREDGGGIALVVEVPVLVALLGDLGHQRQQQGL